MPYENAAPILKHLFVDSLPKDHSKTDKNSSSKESPDKDQPWKVLIVEDEALVAENMREILEAASYIVLDLLSTGDEVVAKYSLLNPDLIVMDVKLPGKTDGIQAATLIHMIKRIPIIFLTAYSEDKFAHLSILSKDSYRYINKPFDLRKLPEFIKKFRTDLQKEAGSSGS